VTRTKTHGTVTRTKTHGTVTKITHTMKNKSVMTVKRTRMKTHAMIYVGETLQIA